MARKIREAQGKTTMALFGPSGAGKTTLLKTLPPADTLCIDLEAGLKSVQDWPGDSIPIRRFSDAVDIACLIGGANRIILMLEVDFELRWSGLNDSGVEGKPLRIAHIV